MPRTPSRPAAVTAVVLLAAGAFVSGCSSSSDAAAPTTAAPSASTAGASTGDVVPTATGAATPSETGSASSGPTSSAAATTSTTGATSATGGAATVGRCTFGQLSVRLGPSEGAAGSIYQPVVFHNDGAACWLDGHPGMDATGPGGTVHAARDGRSSTGSATVRRIVLARGGDASALIHASNVASGSATTCPGDFTSILVTPPDLRSSARLTTQLPACPGLTIGPVVAGTSG